MSSESGKSSKAAFGDAFAAPDMKTGQVERQETLDEIRKKTRLSRSDLKKKDLEKESCMIA